MKYLISFPSKAMVATGSELEAASRDSHAVIEAAKAAGVYVFGGGIEEKGQSTFLGWQCDELGVTPRRHC